jgi:ABC-2 type transport system ATP-binding protein
VGYLPEDLQFPRHQTARTALEYYGRLSGQSFRQIRSRRESLLSTVGLKDRDRESVKRYSKGMLQRLGLAQALLHDPEVLILDEPTDGLDPVGRSQVRSILVQLRDEGRTVFLNSHLLQEVELVCDRVAILDEGQLRFEGTIADLTPTHETAVMLEVAGTEAEVRAALGDRAIEQFRAVASGRLQAIVPLSSQEEVDRLVDDVRQAGISILTMVWRRKTLEDAFLELVTQKAELVTRKADAA